MTLRELVPPVPVQESWKVVLAFNADVTSEPLTALVPLQPPEAEQEEAFVVDHVSVLLPPAPTVVGFAVRLSVGGDDVVTPTVTLLLIEPALPEQVSVYVDALVSAAVDAEPLVARLPDQAPEAVQLVTFVLVHERVLALPLFTLVGFALRVREGVCGVETVTVTLRDTVPPAPVQARE